MIGISWLFIEDGWYLWSVETNRETSGKALHGGWRRYRVASTPGVFEFLNLCRRVVLIKGEDVASGNEPVTAAINHPVGHVAQALINLWFMRKPKDNDKLPKDLEPLFTELCTTASPQFRHARVVFAAHLIALFRVDRAWTEINLLPAFDWDADSDEARSVWEGYFWSGRLYYPLLKMLKRDFLKTVEHVSSFGRHSQNFVPLLTYHS